MNYLEFIEQLKEGLITTHDITKYSHIITDYLDKIDIIYSINIVDKFEFLLSIETKDMNLINVINHDCYTLGYFPAYYYITLNNDMRNGFKEISSLSNNTKSVDIRYESKYDDGIYKNDIICPNKLYHLSYQENKDSIFKKGIYPKSKKRLSIHPDRIYLFDNINNYNELLTKLKFTDTIKKDYILLEINCIKDSLMLHTDPNYRLGYFTYDNINPKNITIIKENL
jgi:hypothetical protein